jgi:hypothetical protein
MKITDDHWIDVRTNGPTLKKKQRSLVRISIWEKRKAERKVYPSRGPLLWGVRKGAEISATVMTENGHDPSNGDTSTPSYLRLPSPAVQYGALVVSSPKCTNYDPFDVLPISQSQWPGVSKTFSLCE